MKKPIKNVNDPEFLEQLMGLGKGSAQKSYYPQLQTKIKELNETNILLSGILQSASEVSIIATDIDGYITFFSTGAEKMLGYKAEELVNKETPLIIHDRDEVNLRAKKLSQTLGREISGFKVFIAKSEIEGSESSEWTYVHKDGSKIDVSLVVTQMHTEDGKLHGFLGIAQDITERKKSELELNRLRNYLSNIVDSMPSVLIGVDSALNITHWNLKAEEYTGINHKVAIGRSFKDIFPNKNFDYDLICESIELQQIKAQFKLLSYKNSQKVYEDVVIYPLKDIDEQGVVIRIDDCTEKVMLEQMLVQNEKMLSVGGLAAGMAHEINNPLAAMMQAAQILEKRLGSSKQVNLDAAENAGTNIEVIWKYLENRSVFKQLKMINDAGIRIAKIIENMLSFARKDEAELTMNNIADLLDKTISIAASEYDLNKHYDFRHIKIDKFYSHNLPLVNCEATKIQQVFLNLLKNSAQAMADKRNLLGDDYEPCLTLSIAADDNYIKVKFRDNGPGIAEFNLKKIFEPFFTTKSVGQGTGLGLSVSYFIITDTHKGNMYVDSKINQGTSFTIELPI